MRFPGHSLRWLLSFTAIYIQILEVTEAVLSGTMYQGVKLHLYLPHVMAFICTISTLAFYDFTETHNIPCYLFALFIYWTLSFLFKILKLSVLVGVGVGFGQSRFVLVLVGLTVYGALVVLDIYVLYQLRYLSKDRIEIVPSEEMKSIKYIHPYANFFSQIRLDWLTPLLRKGYKTTLDLPDLGAIPTADRCRTNHDRFEEIYNAEKDKASENNGKISLFKVYILTFWKPMFIGGIIKVVAEMLVFVPPIGVDVLVQYVQRVVEHKNQTYSPLPIEDQYVSHAAFFSNGFVIAIVMLLSNLIQGTCWQAQFYLAVKQGIRCKGAVQAMVYSKALRLSTWTMSEGGVSVGQVMNHMSVDPLNLVWLFYFGNFTWSLPLQIAVGVVLLYVQLGVSGLIGAFIILISCPLNLLLAKVLAEQEEKILQFSDIRLQKVNEVLQSIKLLKMYAWEMLFKKSVEKTRNKELQYVFKACVIRILCGIIVDGFPLIAILVTFTVYPFLEDKPLEAGKVFSSVALFNLMAVPIIAVPMIVGIIAHAYVSTKRLSRYLATPELCTTTVDTIPSTQNGIQPEEADADTDGPRPATSPSAVMSIKKGTFSWDLNGQEPIMHDLDVDIPQGHLSLVVGQVGSGKSSLLSALVGEMTKIAGTVSWQEGVKVAFGAQKAWLMNATLKENILFGHELDEERYKQVLHASALKPDLEILPAGDETEIGEKGINLSGGQKQRISIARTMYTDADVILLDDPFSALDVHVGSHIFKEGVAKYLLKRGKTVIVVTHQLQFLPYAHQIIAMKGGKIEQIGSLKDIKQNNPEMYEEWKITLGKSGDSSTNKEDTDKDTSADHSDQVVMGSGMRSYLSTVSLGQISGYGDLEDEQELEEAIKAEKEEAGKTLDNEGELGKLIEDEERNVGAVQASVYWSYFKSATIPFAVWTIMGYAIRQAFRMATDFWLAKWSEDAHKHAMLLNATTPIDNQTVPEDNVDGYNEQYYIAVFASVCVASVVFGSVASSSMYLSGLKASKFFHSGMLSRLVLAPMRFFDTTPIGRVINRFAGDTNIIDHKIPTNLDNLVYCIFYCFGGILVNAISTPYFIIPVIPILLIYFSIQRFFVSSSRELQRIDNVSKSPVLAQFSETLGGLTTIRAYRHQQRFQTRNWKLVDDNNTASLYLHSSIIWMGVRLDYLGAIIVFVSSICSIVSGIHGGASPGVVGLAVAYAIMISGLLNWMMRYVSEAEMYFNCIERVGYYTRIATEAVTQTTPQEPSAQWPASGSITFNNVSLRYDYSLDPVIENLSLEIGGGEKIGICGRTGSGKSSLTPRSVPCD